MIERHSGTGGRQSRAFYSPCDTYRYGLERIWGTGPRLMYVMLNPSTATEEVNDPTIERCERRAVQLGFKGMRIANLFAFRATKPEDLKKAADPIGPENDALLRAWAAEADMVLAAWGVHGDLMGRAAQMAPVLPGRVCHLGLTKAGHPRHPLYVSYAVVPADWPAEQRYAG